MDIEINFYDLPSDILKKIYMINHRLEQTDNKLKYNNIINELTRLHNMHGYSFYRNKNLLKRINRNYKWWQNNMCWDNLK